MNIIHDIYLISDSTGETIDRIFLALKAQFKDFQYNNHQFSFKHNLIKSGFLDLISLNSGRYLPACLIIQIGFIL